MFGDPIEYAAPYSGRQPAGQELAIFDAYQRCVTATVDMHMRRIVVAVKHLDLNLADNRQRRHPAHSATKNIAQKLLDFKIYSAGFATNYCLR
jgi:hypothetical protein